MRHTKDGTRRGTKNYTDPWTVISPKNRWTLVDVPYDGGAGDHSLAIGKWDDRLALGIRWNGENADDVGSPQSRGNPTWFILPRDYYPAILGVILKDLPPDKQLLARALLKLESAEES